MREGGTIWNGRHATLLDDVTPRFAAKSNSIRIGQSTYFDAICTQEFTLRQVRRVGLKTPLHRGIDHVRHNDRLVRIDDPDIPSITQIGVSILAWTSDGCIVLQIQGQEKLVSRGNLIPSASGSLDWADVRRGDDRLRDVVIRGALRELREECGIPRRGVNQDSSRLVGYARLLDRGGKPEFFVTCKLSVPTRSVKKLRRERGFVAHHHGPRPWTGGADDWLAEVKDAYAAQISPQLELAARFAAAAEPRSFQLV